jgi:hypothetical protein
LSSATLWWRGPQWLTQEPSSWPTTDFNSPTENLEIRTVHVAQPPEDITQRFSKLDSSELLHTAEDLQPTADNPRPPGKLLL